MGHISLRQKHFLFFFGILFLFPNFIAAQTINKPVESRINEERYFPDFDMIVGWSMNIFPSTANEYLEPGHGLNLRCILKTRKNYLIGFGVNSYTSKIKKLYPFGLNRQQIDKPSFSSLGLMYGKRLSKFDGLVEVQYTVQNAFRLEPEDKLKEYQIRGLSAGISFNVPIAINTDPLQFYLSNNVEYLLALNLHGGIKYNWFSFESLSGPMIEIGIGMRLHRNMNKTSPNSHSI